MAALSGGRGARRGCTRHHRRIHHSRLHGHGHGPRRFHLNHPRRSFVRLGQDSPPPLVRASHQEDVQTEMNRSKWDQRVERADALTAAHSFAAEVLQFYKRMALFQQALYSDGEKVCGNESGKSLSSFQLDLNVHPLLPKFAEFLSTVERCAPQLMAQSARDLNAQGSERWQDLLISFWRSAPDFQSSPGQPEVLMAWIFLQPQAEYLADHNGHISL